MNKKILTIVLLALTLQSYSHANEKEEIIKQIEGEKISLETGRPKDPNETYNQFKSKRIKRIRELNKQLKKLEAKK